MKRLKIIWHILQTTHSVRILTFFLIFIFFAAWILLLSESSIKNYGDAIWYCLITITTVGFADIYAVTLIGRVVTVILLFYGILVIALVSSLWVNYYQEIMKIKEKKFSSHFLDKIESLPQLTKEELEELSQTFRHIRHEL